MKIPNEITSFDMKKIRMISSTATYGIIQTQGFISAINPFKKHFAAKHITPANNIIHYLIYLNGKFGHIKGIPLQGLQTTKGIPLQGLQTTKQLQHCTDISDRNIVTMSTTRTPNATSLTSLTT